ncbi:PREDICTED: UBX domain-containing protein 1 isoform X1 [Erythranthe guttata]|uniref:UBX domain-containing protein 1 isoform X1 n=1 Tax=Erythranthe guttata TaxID=4155 RepID=UPI00064DFFB0|nr:PREDICTED: UBX domain-containing protein 1 isoform X1 [Erythranthe guttata]|eukprot:XP_012835191.1 PREDICTED: UBX domain-containing protein 1 isoform X1 [Erythranthe guttata]
MEVYKRLVGELEEMGFSKAIATKAICSGNSSIEDAINWLVEHENDTADSEPQTPMKQAEVLVNVNIEESDGFHISEDIKLRAKELRNQAWKRKAELERKLERQREKERIRAGKELLEAKRMAEESERKRFLSQNKAEKDEERRARENIRQKLQQDKLERREMLGLPREAPVPVKVKPETAEPQITKKLEPVDPGLSPVKPAAVRDNMRECLRSIKRQNKDDNAKAMRAFKTLLIYVTNIFNNPDNDKLRKIRISNPLFQERVGKFEGIEFLELCGFERVDGGKFLLLPRENVDIGVLKSAAIELHNASTNPFFGLLSG